MSENPIAAKWRKMAAPMKRIVVCTAITSVLAAVVLCVFVVAAIQEQARLAKAFSAVRENFDNTHKKIASMGVQREKTAAAEQNLKTRADSDVLVPLLGSLEMKAMASIAPLASAAGVTILGDSVKSLPQRAVKDPKSISGPLYVRLPIEFSGSGSYRQIVSFVRAVESQLPMVSLSSIQIVSQTHAPEVHAMAVSFEWLVGVENKIENKIENKAEDEVKSEAKPK